MIFHFVHVGEEKKKKIVFFLLFILVFTLRYFGKGSVLYSFSLFSQTLRDRA